MDTRFAISEYLDAAQVTAQLDALIKKPIYSISPAALKKYEEEYFDKKCAKSKAMITEAKEIIPGGVQHNLAFNYPFPIVMTKAKGAKLYDIDGNEYYDFLQAGGPTILGSNDDVVKEKVKELLDDCGPSTGLFHEYEYKLAKKISDCVPSVEMFRMLGSGTEACMCEFVPPGSTLWAEPPQIHGRGGCPLRFRFPPQRSTGFPDPATLRGRWLAEKPAATQGPVCGCSHAAPRHTR